MVDRCWYLCEGSYPLSELGLHLRQSLGLADGLLQLLFSQLKLLLELPVSVFSLQQTNQKQTVIGKQAEDSSVLHPGLRVFLLSSTR